MTQTQQSDWKLGLWIVNEYEKWDYNIEKILMNWLQGNNKQ